MTLDEIKRKLHEPEYNFLREDKRLGKNIILLGLGGSHAYGTSNEKSDIDVRGIALNSKKEILLGRDFEQVTNNATDTTVYSLKKMSKLLADCNPNTIEILGLKPEHYLYLSSAGKELLNNKDLFLSRKAIYTFGCYAEAQLYKLKQLLTGTMNTKELEEHILKRLLSMQENFVGKYTPFSTDQIKLYIDNAIQQDYETEIFMDVNLTHYPLRDYKSMWNEMHNMVKDYANIGKRNKNAIEHGKLGKHQMNIIRLHYMCLDILENKEIVTYREKEHDLLMDIRNEKYLDSNYIPIPEFYEIVSDLEKRFKYAAQNTDLPAEPNVKEIDELIASINEAIIKEDLSIFQEANIDIEIMEENEELEI